MGDKQFEAVRGTALTLYNRFAELMLLVGLDENTGLVPCRKDSDSDEGDDQLSQIFFDEYQAHVLAAISASKALVFQPKFYEDPAYPPSSTAQPLRSESQEQTFPHRNKHSRHPVPVNPALIKQHLSQKGFSGSSAKSFADLPLSKDVIETITIFCFPDNVHVYREKPDNSIHFLVLTDVSGSKTYATCLTFYKLYKLTKEGDGTLSYALEISYHKSQNTAASIHCYIPQCCVLVSKYPYYYAMKECLSCMISHIERDVEEMHRFLKDFTYTMTMSPVPPAGNVIVEMNIYNLSVTLFPAESPEKPVIDLPLHLVFLCFPIDELLKIFTAILCEERIVFVSCNYALLTIVMESFLYYILPFNWRFTYVPILSASSLELLEAPGTFMMGCHSNHLSEVERVEGLIVVNIDDGTVSVNAEGDPSLALSSSQNSSDSNCVDSFIPNLPQEPADLFKQICKRGKFQMELSDVQRPFYYDIEAERAFRMKKCMNFNTEISFAFLEMMVNLFRGILPCLRPELRRFNKTQFMETIQERDKPFYDKVLSTDMFKQFLEDRMNDKTDYWSDYEIKTHPWTKRGSIGGDPLVLPLSKLRIKPVHKQVSITMFSSLAPRVFDTFRLPPLNDSVTYAKNAIALLNNLILECHNSTTRSSYIYLRGMFHAAEGSVMASLEDLLSLPASNARLLPIVLVRKLMQLIPESEREELVKKKGVSYLPFDLEHEKATPRWIVDKVPMPVADLSLDDFINTVSLLEMATDYDTIQRLFIALALPQRRSHVCKYTFQVLTLCYEENLAICESVNLTEGTLQAREIILKVSNLIKTDFGTGRIGLTDKRLFFIKDVSNKYREIVKLRAIAKLEKVQSHTFLKTVDALFITDTTGKVKFSAWLKDERNCWWALIEEMRAGKTVAETTKDFTAIGQAMQNVLLVDAVIKSGQDPNVTHHTHVTHAAETLCYFTGYISEGRHNLPKDTITALQHRVDPNIGQRERRTVEVMLYTPGSQGSSTIPPRLWCGMGDGKVRVFDATNWSLERSFVQTTNTVSSLVAVGETQVWAGSLGIFIIETDTITCNKTLTDHSDLVADIVVSHHGRHAYSASVGGLIICWELQTLRPVRTFSLLETQSLRSIKLYDDKLWCGTWKGIIALDLEGNQLESFSHKLENDPGSVVDIDCFEIFNDEIWAGCRREGQLVIWDEKTTMVKKILKAECRGISVILVSGDKVWIGTKDGTIYIYYAESKQLWKTIKAHDDAIRSLCAAEARYIMSGAGSKDGKVAIWSPNVETSDTEGGLNAD